MIRFLIPEPKNRRSGGTLYDLQMVEAIQEKGYEIELHWIEKNMGVKAFISDLEKDDLLVIDGLVFHQNYKDAYLLNDFKKIYLTHLPFWLEPGIDGKEIELRKLREIDFIKRCNLVICTSDYIKDEIIQSGIDAKSILVINPLISGSSEEKRAYNKKPKEFLFVGAVHFGKGLDILTKALAQIENSHWELKVAGDFNPGDEYFKTIIKGVKKSGLSSKIRFLGACDAEKIRELYLNSDLLIHPSRFESYGMAIGEALSLGLPVLASDAGALPSVYSSTPVRFFKSENVTSLTENFQSIVYPKGYLSLVQNFENYIFKSGKNEYSDMINKLNSQFK